MSIEEKLDLQEKGFWDEFNKFIKDNAFGDSLFRGESKQYDVPLMPSLYRKYDTGDFRTEGREGHTIKYIEECMLEEFKRNALSCLASEHIPQNDLEWMILAQHYHLPTRLLDWTTNPMVALFFAVEKHPDENAIIYKSCQELAEYNILPKIRLTNGKMELEGKNFHPLSISKIPKLDLIRPNYENEVEPIIFFRPKYSDVRYANQHAVIACPEKHGVNFKQNITGSINVPVFLKPRLRAYLRKIGVSSATIYPGLMGVAAMVTAKLEDDFKHNIHPSNRATIR